MFSTVAKDVNQLNCCLSFDIFEGGNVSCDFDVCFDLEPNGLAFLEAFGPLLQPEEQGNPLCPANLDAEPPDNTTEMREWSVSPVSPACEYEGARLMHSCKMQI